MHDPSITPPPKKRVWITPRLIDLTSVDAARAKFASPAESGPRPKITAGAEGLSIGPGTFSYGMTTLPTTPTS